MVRVGEDQEILTLEPCHVRSWNGRQGSRSITRTIQSITTGRAIVSQERIRVYSYACFG